MKSFSILAAACALLAHSAHRHLDRIELPVPSTPHETFASPEALRWMSLGYPTLVADYYWLRALSTFGDDSLHTLNYPNLKELVERVVALDPDFAGAYIFAGTALTLPGMDPEPALRILAQGTERRPDEWRIPFLLGFNAYYFADDFATAADALAIAAKHPDAPAHTGLLSSLLSAEMGEPEVGLGLIEVLLAQTHDEKTREMYLERQKQLVLELHLNQLDAAIRRYHEERGRAPDKLDELVTAGLIEQLPQEPFDGEYYLGPDGNVRTTSPVDRLRLDPKLRNPHLQDRGGAP